jgi:UDP-3-O-[3-hydroxymyristoyl] N-acetylglucosamine deacetylase/3-hydroxyacyl-[acyl-carrier-protein] dehydratase
LNASRKTIGRDGDFTGVGLHTGEEVRLCFRPADPGAGIAFVRTDLDARPRIPASIDRVDRTQPRRTVLRTGDAEVQTVEHLLSACAGLGIDDLEIEMNGPEVPGGDGSASVFVEVLGRLGARTQDGERRTLTVRRPVMVRDGEASAAAVPNPGGGLRISYVLEYRNPLLRHQTFAYEGDFTSALAPARTFCLEEEVAVLRKMGFGKGANTDNTVVVAPDGSVHGDEGLRFPDECARHKVLDLLGDLTLAGAPVEAQIFARKTGHKVNHLLVRKIVDYACRIEPQALDVRRIAQIIPHRYPFLLVDRVLECEPGVRAVGVKNISVLEDVFEGHFPDEPLMPGVLQVEAMAQLAGAMLLWEPKGPPDSLAMVMSLDHVRFRRTVRPGDRMVITVEAQKVRSRTAQVLARAEVEAQICAEARLRFIMVRQ